MISAIESLLNFWNAMSLTYPSSSKVTSSGRLVFTSYSVYKWISFVLSLVFKVIFDEAMLTFATPISIFALKPAANDFVN